MSERFLPVAGSDRPLPPAGLPPFERIAIVGLGLIGGSIALASRRQWPSSLVIAVDDKRVLEKAMVRQAIDVAADDPVILKEADLVILAAPVEQNQARLATLPADVPGRAVVTDTGGTKRSTVAAAAGLPPRLTFVGGHPLAGAAEAGIEAARADLFRARPWLFTPTPGTPAPELDRLQQFVRGLGAHPRTIDPGEHDRVLALISHLPQLTVSALLQVVGDGAQADGLALAGRGLRDTTRLASSPPTIWKDICRTNADHVGDALDRLIAVLLELRGDLNSGDSLERVFAAARAWKARMPSRGES